MVPALARRSVHVRANGSGGMVSPDHASARCRPCMQAEAVAALSVRGNFMFDPATHRDFLGALLGTGVERGKVRAGPMAV